MTARKTATTRKTATPAKRGGAPAKKPRAKKPAQAAQKRPAGRPELHTPELANEFCRRIMEGRSMRSVCSDEDMPHRNTVLKWVHDDTAGFFSQYRRACATRTEVQRDEIIDIADQDVRVIPIEWEKKPGHKVKVPVLVSLDANELRHRELRIKTRQWDMARQAPKVYGDRVGLTDGEGNNVSGLVLFVKDMTGRKD